MKKITNIVSLIIEFIKNNILFLTFVATNLINCFILRAVTIQNILSLRSIIGDIIILLLLALIGYFFSVSKRWKYYFIISFVITIILIINSIYFTFFGSFVSISLIATSLQVVDVADAVVNNVLEIKDFIYLWQPLLLISLYWYFKKSSKYNKIFNEDKRYMKIKNLSLTIFIIFIIFGLTLNPNTINKFHHTWNKKYTVQNFGILIYHFSDIFLNIGLPTNSIYFDKAYADFKKYVANNTTNSNEYSNIFENKNIIMIHAESIQSLTLDKKFNNQEVTPTLNKLKAEGIYFSNYYSPISIGSSSDAEFTLLTSLMPANKGTIFMSHTDNTYVSLPQLLNDKGYYTFSIHGNIGSFWNRNVMHPKLGYQEFIDQEQFVQDEIIGLGLSDESFFKQSVAMIKERQAKHSKFMVNLIMLSNHTPFDDFKDDLSLDLNYYYKDNNGILQKDSYLEQTKIGNYFKSVHYADKAIGNFLKKLEQEKLLDNTVIIIYGDHDSRLNIKEFDILKNYDFEKGKVIAPNEENYSPLSYYEYELMRKVPFIIWTKDQKFKQEITKPMSSLDVLPTLSNMFNIYNEFSLGKDIFNVDNNSVLFANGNWLNKDIYYNSQTEEIYHLNSNNIINKNNLNDLILEHENKMIMADNIIEFDLIRKYKEEEQNEK